MNANDAPLQAQLMPFLHQCSDPFGAEARVLDVVTDLLVAIGRACKPIEVEAWLIEQLHEVEWRAKPESPIQRASVVFLVTAIQVYGRAVLEPLTRYEDVAATKSDFIANVCREALLVTEKLLEDRARHVDAQTITHCVLDVIGYYRSVLSGDQVGIQWVGEVKFMEWEQHVQPRP
ncbi:hypothetical protein BC940DRAFT_125137 [Gongronella butleri]|nr:hypothetical protein BC940DRAFT_125137 [Gongronella butleri]